MKVRARMKRETLKRYRAMQWREFVRGVCERILDDMMERLVVHIFPFPGPAARPGKFRVGDIVTRAGDDLQRVTEIDDEGFCMTVVCVHAPASGWCKVGEEERNLCRRYQFPSDEDHARIHERQAGIHESREADNG